MLGIVAEHPWGLDAVESFTEHETGKTGPLA